MSVTYFGNLPLSVLTTNIPDQKMVSWFSGPEVSGTIFSMRLYPYGTSGVLKKFRGVLYSCVSGEPDVLLGQTEIVTVYGVLTTSTYYHAKLEVPYSFVSGEQFYLGLHSADSGTGAVRRNLTGTGTSRYNSDEFDDGPTDPFGTVSNSTIYIKEIAFYSYGTNYEVSKALGFALLEQTHIGVPKAVGFACIENMGIKVSKAVGFALLDVEEEGEEEESKMPFVMVF